MADEDYGDDDAFYFDDDDYYLYVEDDYAIAVSSLLFGLFQPLQPTHPPAFLLDGENPETGSQVPGACMLHASRFRLSGRVGSLAGSGGRTKSTRPFPFFWDKT